MPLSAPQRHPLAEFVMVELDRLGRQVSGDRAWHATPYLARHPDGRTNLAGCAIAALKAIMLDKGMLQRM
jgi:hypothetical protein